MADTSTVNLAFTKPEVGGSTDTWGTKNNANWDAVDAIFSASGIGTSVGLNVGSGKTIKVDGTFNSSASATVIIKGATVTTAGAALLDDADAAAQRTTLGLVIGTNVQAQDAELQAIAGLTSAADKGIYFTGSGTAGMFDLSAFSRTVLDDGSQGAWQTTLGLVPGTNVQAFDATLAALAAANWALNAFPIGTGADTLSQVSFAANTFPGRSSTGNLVAKTITDLAFSLLDDSTTGAMQTTLGLVIGTNVQAFDSTLAALAGANWAANSLAIGSGTDTVAQVTFAANTFPGRSSTGNLVAKAITDFGFSLVDDADATAARSTLGLVIGTNVQAFDATLNALAGANWATDSLAIGTGADTVGQVTFAANTFPAKASTGALVAKPITDFGLSLLDDAAASNARTTLGLVIGTNVQAADATLTALAGQNWATDSLAIGTGVDTVGQVTFAANTFPAKSSAGALVAKPISDFALTILDDTTQAAVRTTLGLTPGTDVQAQDATLQALAGANWAANTLPIGSGTDTVAQITFNANTFPARASTGNLVAKAITDFGLSLVDDSTAADARTTLGLVIGTNVQAQDATLQSIAALGTAADRGIYFTGVDTAAEFVFTSFGRSLVDDAAASNARTTLELGSMATRNVTVSTSAPSGGADGDLWFVREA